MGAQHETDGCSVPVTRACPGAWLLLGCKLPSARSRGLLPPEQALQLLSNFRYVALPLQILQVNIQRFEILMDGEISLLFQEHLAILSHASAVTLHVATAWLQAIK